MKVDELSEDERGMMAPLAKDKVTEAEVRIKLLLTLGMTEGVRTCYGELGEIRKEKADWQAILTKLAPQETRQRDGETG